MLNKLFPPTLNNNYQGSVLAQWAFVVITIVTLVRSLIHMFAVDGGAQSIAHIPLDTFSSNAAAAVILLMHLWGLSQLLMALVYVVVLWRYRALIPFMYLLLFFEYSGRMIFMHFIFVQTTGVAPGHVADFVIVPLLAVIFCLSLF